MQEYLELRVREDHAHLVFNANEGEKLGSSVRLVRIATDDARITTIAERQHELRNRGEFLVAGWEYIREYDDHDLETAAALQLSPARFFEPAGEECGTVYDESSACTMCGAGRRQISPLRLDVRRVPRSVDMAATIAGEVIVSQRAAEAFVKERLRGFALHPVEHVSKYTDAGLDLSSVPAGRELVAGATDQGIAVDSWEFNVWLNQDEQRAALRRAFAQRVHDADKRGLTIDRELPVWYQLQPTGAPVNVSEMTKVGISPFEQGGVESYPCPVGDTLGLNMLSELWIVAELPSGIDLSATRQFVGKRQGVLSPKQLLVVSQQFRRAVSREKLRGFSFEVTRLAAKAALRS